MNAISMDMVSITGEIEVQKVLDFAVSAKVNEHAYLDFKGIVSAERELEDLMKQLEGQEMCLRCDGVSYFAGKIIRIKMSNEGEYYMVEARCISGSYCFDIKTHNRSFQDTAMTYEQMLKTVERDSGTGNILPIAGRKTEIGYPIIQYEETDWEFTKRMASHFGTVVIPEIAHGEPQISMGIIEGKEYTIDEHAEYEIIKSLGEWHAKETTPANELSRFIHYKVREYRNFELGDKVKFLGYPLTVMAKHLSVKDGLMEAVYELGYENEYGLKRLYNTPIAGKSIQGKVLATKGEKLKIHLDIDEKQAVEKAYWYTWMPQTGNIFYCMPKLGTKVNLYFSDKHEGNAISTECVRTNGGGMCREMQDYAYRQFLTEHDKRIAFSPGYLFFVGNSQENKNVLNLIDGRGISLESNQKIFVSGMNRLSVLANCMVKIQAGTYLKMSKTGEKSGIELTGSEINKFAEKIWHSGLPKEEQMQDLEMPKPSFPAALFSGTVAAMVPASSVGANSDPAKMSMLGMANIGICTIG